MKRFIRVYIDEIWSIVTWLTVQGYTFYSSFELEVNDPSKIAIIQALNSSAKIF